MTTFKDSLTYGQAGETAIAKWLRSQQGMFVLPAYEKILDTGKGPQLYTPEGKRLILPDLLAFDAKRTLWIEAKRKTAFTWWRKSRHWQTGIDLRHYFDYCKVDDETPWRVWLLFLQEGGQAKDSPPNSPKGLFGRSLAYLRKHEDHRDETTRMVYWNMEDLTKLAELGTT